MAGREPRLGVIIPETEPILYGQESGRRECIRRIHDHEDRNNNQLVQEIRLVDMQGRTVHSERNTPASRIVFDLSDLAMGNYAVQLLSHEGVVLTVQQLAVAH